ncbi:prolyl aminopeptidase [Cochlodiniinecator piscidefendens]|uniref:prolyl aminopeptidase n=1 Tax=Cochlodiniinecator piscidefendens TaxID=2715756 RepID=UPI00140E4BF1|nr:prolyl aminopeptidase [Cochlodiniinecator piscidefendens]
MDRSARQKGASFHLFPPIEPFDRRMMDVGDGHQIYVEQCGARDGIPVIVLHGGPGGGTSPFMRRFFDPKIYRIVLFDQRGCGRSKPSGSVESNTTWDLVADIERIREAFEIERWIVFGGSWGATLSLIYAISHPDRAAALALRGVFLATKAELDWFYEGGVSAFWPDLWDEFVGLLPMEERGEVIKNYHGHIHSGSYGEEVKYARAWTVWENALAAISSNGRVGPTPSDYALSFAKLESHYFINGAFLECDDWIIKNADRIAHIPGVIVQGRFDMICPPSSAYRLSKAWPKSDLRLIGQAGHALSEAGIMSELLTVMEDFADMRTELAL